MLDDSTNRIDTNRIDARITQHQDVRLAASAASGGGPGGGGVAAGEGEVVEEKRRAGAMERPANPHSQSLPGPLLSTLRPRPRPHPHRSHHCRPQGLHRTLLWPSLRAVLHAVLLRPRMDCRRM